jgi:hypothetical protein
MPDGIAVQTIEHPGSMIKRAGSRTLHFRGLMHLKAVFAQCAIDRDAFKKRRFHMKRLLLIAATLALLVGVTGAYAWDQQATDDQMNYQATHGQTMPTADWPNETTGRY